ncbi:hypothetical protein BDW22DRAFT_849822 [Trametopsis cervina]|nr:hypothetical protein BDW22DRAFT_849822 [Trametopsis cervina]
MTERWWDVTRTLAVRWTFENSIGALVRASCRTPGLERSSPCVRVCVVYGDAARATRRVAGPRGTTLDAASERTNEWASERGRGWKAPVRPRPRLPFPLLGHDDNASHPEDEDAGRRPSRQLGQLDRWAPCPVRVTASMRQRGAHRKGFKLVIGRGGAALYSGWRPSIYPSVYPCTLGRKGRGRCRSSFRVCERNRSRSLRVCCVGGPEGWRMEDVRVEDTVTDRADWNTVRGQCVGVRTRYGTIAVQPIDVDGDVASNPHRISSRLRRGRREKRRADSGISKCARGMVSKAQQRTFCSHGLSQIAPPRRLNSMLADGGRIPWTH